MVNYELWKRNIKLNQEMILNIPKVAFMERYYDGFELMFCAHHGKEYAEKLAAIAVKIQDETDRLVETK